MTFRSTFATYALSLSCLVAGCREAVFLGDDCAEPGCGCTQPACVCADAGQDIRHLPMDCDPTSQTCDGQAIPDGTAACVGCLEANAADGLGRNALLDCACRHCAVPLSACRNSSDQVRNQYCQALVNCALREGCAGGECYCGKGVTMEECLARDAGLGPCADIIGLIADEVADCAPGESRPACVMRAQQGAGDNALHRAFVVSQCTGNPTFDIPGHCPSDASSIADGGASR